MHYKVLENVTIQYVDIMYIYPTYASIAVSHRSPTHPFGRCVQVHGSLLPYGRYDKLYYRSARDVVPSGSFPIKEIRISRSVYVENMSKIPLSESVCIQRMRIGL